MFIKDVAKVQGGYAFKSDNFISNAIPIIRIGNIESNNIVNIDLDICSDNDFWSKHPEFRVEKGDILIAMSGATVGKVGKLEYYKKALLNQRVCKLVPNEKVFNDYLFYYCLSPSFKKQILENAFGCAQPNISGKQIESFSIKVPTIKEQKVAIDKFKCLHKIINQRQQQLEQLDTLIKARFVEMFGDVVVNDKGFHIVKLSDIATYWNGLTYKPENVQEQGIIVLRSSNIQHSKLDFNDVVRVDCKIKEKQFVQNNDILMCSRNGSSKLVGKVALIRNINEPMSFGAFMMIIRSSYNSYLMSYFQTDAFRRQISTGATTTINQITGNMLNQINLPLPPIELQNEFAEFVAQVDKSKVVVQKALDEAQLLFESLMQEYFG